MKRQTNEKVQEEKYTELPKEENSCNKCWNSYKTDLKGPTAPRYHEYYISENVYIVEDNFKNIILCKVARCPNCGNLKRDSNGVALLFHLGGNNGKYGLRDYKNWELLKKYHISFDQLEGAVIDWPSRKTIVLDPKNGLKYYNVLDPLPEESFTEYAKRYGIMCKNAGRWL